MTTVLVAAGATGAQATANCPEPTRVLGASAFYGNSDAPVQFAISADADSVTVYTPGSQAADSVTLRITCATVTS